MQHKKRLSLSAGEDANSPTNLAILCRCCHARHTEAEQLALGDNRSLTIESQVSTRMKHLLDSTSPPPQIVWGQREKAKRTPPPFSGALCGLLHQAMNAWKWCVQNKDEGAVWCVDTNACRWSALTNRKDGGASPFSRPCAI